jgi:MFS family permease
MRDQPSAVAILPDATAPATHVRYFILVLLALSAGSAYLTRLMPAAATTVQKELGLTGTELGYVLSGFAFGYFWFQIPGGWLGNHLGARRMLPVLSIAWSWCTLWVSLARTGTELYWARVALGLAQAGLMPGIALVLADWFPVGQRGMASSVIAISMQVGAVLANGLTAELVDRIGWRPAFALYSITGMAWAAAFVLFFRNRPEDHPWTNAAECALIRGDSASEKPRTASAAVRGAVGDPWTVPVLLLTSISLWAVCAQSFFRAYAYDFYYNWFPAFMEKGHGVPTKEAGMLGMIPQVAGGAGCLAGGVLVDVLLHWTGSKWLSRSGLAALGLAACAAATGAATLARDPVPIALWLSAGAFCASLAGPAAWAATIDIGAGLTGVIFGIMNMAGNVGAYACPIHVGALVDYIDRTDGDWNLVLYLFVAVNLVGALCWLFLNPNRPVLERGFGGQT